MTRVAAIDLGTNSTRLLVADVAGGSVDEVERRLQITGLGQGVDGRRRLLPAPIARVRTCLTDYRRRLDELGVERVLAIATSAVRDAENGEAFLAEIAWSYGFETRLLTGDEEAALTLRGVSCGRPVGERTLVVDIGGGSTELVLGGPDGVAWSVSLELGCVRMTERHLASDPPTRAELEACAAAARALLPPLEVDAAVGVAGTVTSLAALDLGLVDYDPARVHGYRLSAARVASQLDRLSALPLSERRAVPGLEPARAAVIVAGATILRELLDVYGLDAIEASERDILDGAALAAAELPEREEPPAPPGAYTCC